ncbi:hypothetical protein [Massilia sp. CCM 8734]|uniref:hypothetical protein n=1 Tax=Massilia sp. CCM 8734 TaxID=2609283 RepID=UPI001420474C|nr:hypothetical protein [Massilia sp. CCM 8734]NHZ99264.1 hypothetical protein [Massilia sp. CCM 8734]
MPQIDAHAARPVGKLLPADLRSCPVWQWAMDEIDTDGQDETWVRPTAHSVVPASACDHYLVSAVAILRDGTEIPACVEVIINGPRKSFHPAFVYLIDRQLPFASHATDKLLSRYTKAANNHPRKWVLDVVIEGERRQRTGRARSRAFAIVLACFDLLWTRHMKKQQARNRGQG